MEYTIALTGNPNVGKTSLYNRITHSLEHVGNWHGVTVKEVSKKIMYDHHTINMVDLPGLYSLSVYSYEEGISRDNVLGNGNDLVVNVCEVNNLSRNLYLTLQLLELNLPLVLVINMMDELKKQGKVLNYRRIEKALQIPIVPMSAKYHSDVHLLMEVSLDYISARSNNLAKLPYLDKLPIEDITSIISEKAVTAGFIPRWAAIKVLENDSFVIEKLNLTDEQKRALALYGDWQSRVAQARYEYIDEITSDAISKKVLDEHHETHEHIVHKVPLENEQNDLTIDKHKKHHDKHKDNSKPYKNGLSVIDKIVLNKYAALPIFFLMMALIFVITFGLVGKFLSWALDLGIERLLYLPLTNWLNGINCPSWIVALLGDGVILGVGGILTFLPQVVLLFFFLALLEDSGYISRVAFMTDGIFRKIGLSGRSAFTMLMGFGCSATAVLTARGLEDKTMRKKTVLLTPFMSCSARLPVYSTIAGAFFLNALSIVQPFVIFGLYILGVVVALTLAAIFEKIKPLKSGKLSFIMEMPPYRFPTVERVFQLIWNNAKVFIIRVGTVIFALNVIVWMLSNFSFVHGYVYGTDYKSILQWVSGFIAPIFKPLGFGNWKAVTSLLSGLVAKEVVISSINSLGGVEALFYGPRAILSALSFLVFTLLYTPCIATLSAMTKEIGFKWTLLSVAIQLGTAYLLTMLFYSVGLLFYINIGLAVGILIVALIALVCALTLVSVIKNRNKCPYSCGSCSKNCNKRKGK